MSYATGEAAALTLIRTLADFDANNSVSLANDSTNEGATLLSSGRDDHYLLLGPGPFQSAYIGIHADGAIHEWETVIKIAVIKTGQQAPEYQLVRLRDSIIALLDSYYEMNNASVGYAKVIGGGAISEASALVTGGTRSIAYVYQEMTLEWHEDESVTQND